VGLIVEEDALCANRTEAGIGARIGAGIGAKIGARDQLVQVRVDRNVGTYSTT
jgi:hypothetical protein